MARAKKKCGVKAKKVNMDYKGMKKALDKALARREGVSMDEMKRINKAMRGVRWKI